METIKNIRIPIFAAMLFMLQAAGFIWYAAQLDATVKSLDATVTDLADKSKLEAKINLQRDVAELQRELTNIQSRVSELNNNTLQQIGAITSTVVNDLEDVKNRLDRHWAEISNSPTFQTTDALQREIKELDRDIRDIYTILINIQRRVERIELQQPAPSSGTVTTAP